MDWLLNSKMLIVGLTIIVLGIGKKFENRLYLYALTLYFSTVLHELAHYIVGKVMLIKIKGARFFPTFSRDLNNRIIVKAPRVEMKSDVGHGFQLIPTALAPISLFYVAYYIETNWFHWFNPTNVLEYVVLLFILVYLLSILVYNAFPSWTDLSYILAFPFAFITWVLIVIGIVIYFNNEVFIELIKLFRA